MKNSLLLAGILFCSLLAVAQDPVPAAKGVTYGAGTTAHGAIPASEIENNIKGDRFTGKATGKVVSVCQEKGCWMKLETKAGETMMVKFKDYGFFMPKDIVGRQVVVDGEAAVKETSVKQLKHYAQDAGKSKDDISRINKPKKELIFTADGVLVL